ncbi:hypothetical protein [Bifidobacterium callitrichidarum]|nr:hypothetical protein [Bifidobacterium callitrichidarum]
MTNRGHATVDRKAMTTDLTNDPELWHSVCKTGHETVEYVLDQIDWGAIDISNETGLCHRLAEIRLTAIVIKALEANMLLNCAKALHEGESKTNILRAMYRAGATFSKFVQSDTGKRIAAELERIEKSDDPDKISVDYSDLHCDII